MGIAKPNEESQRGFAVFADDHAVIRNRYVVPAAIPGTRVECEVRGRVNAVGLSDAPQPWPIGESNGERSLVVYKGLSKALRQETAGDVAAAWGVSLDAVRNWRQSLGLPEQDPGAQPTGTEGLGPVPVNTRRWTAYEDEIVSRFAPALAAQKLRRSFQQVMKRRSKLGLPHLKPGPLPISGERGIAEQINRPWTAAEDAIVLEASAGEAAQRTGRSIKAVYLRRYKLRSAPKQPAMKTPSA